MKVKSVLLSLFVALGTLGVARAADDAAAKAAAERQKMVEMHEKMAALHTQAAECLKAGKTVKECHDAMAAQCPMNKDGTCPMMGSMCPMGRGQGLRGQGRGQGRGRGPGMGRGRGMGPAANAPAAAEDPKKP
jgi:hypothetical protein